MPVTQGLLRPQSLYQPDAQNAVRIDMHRIMVDCWGASTQVYADGFYIRSFICAYL